MGGVFGLTTNATSTLPQFGWFGKSPAPTELAHDLNKTVKRHSGSAASSATGSRDFVQSMDREPVRN
jgi:hypothetical protein